MDDIVAEVVRQMYVPDAPTVIVTCRVHQESIAFDDEDTRWLVRRTRRVRRDPAVRLFHVEQSETRVQEDLADVDDDWPLHEDWRVLVSFSSAALAVDCLLDRADANPRTPTLQFVVNNVVLRAVDWEDRSWAARALLNALG